MDLAEVVNSLHPVCREVFKERFIPAAHALRRDLEEVQPECSLSQDLKVMSEAYTAMWDRYITYICTTVANPEAAYELFRNLNDISRVISPLQQAVDIAQEKRPESLRIAVQQFDVAVQYLLSRLPKQEG
ncbi:hypothetical protein HYS50_02720 [Candidatus Woesearchaeota archaeon]|nr:hypothetical protein [Candidatus Woesearchaeota archaeon]